MLVFANDRSSPDFDRMVMICAENKCNRGLPLLADCGSRQGASQRLLSRTRESFAESSLLLSIGPIKFRGHVHDMFIRNRPANSLR